MKKIPLSKDRGEALVSDADAELVQGYTWWLAADGYVKTTIREAGKVKQLFMHRLILGLHRGDGFETDHRNRDKLDNRRCNLRLCTKSQNGQNRRPKSGGTSDYRGVNWDLRLRKWRVVMGPRGHRRHLGYFESEIEAAKAYDRAAHKQYGDFAYLNFPDEMA